MMKPKRIKPGPDQESVWDYPRPPRVEDSKRHLKVIFNEVLIAESREGKRVIETSSPPVYYIPPKDIKVECMIKSMKHTLCEWKGIASYYTIVVGDKRAENAAWYYTDPTPDYISIKNYVAFYPQQIDACYLDGELVKAQSGSFYGGWITSEVVGPFKGEPGTEGW